MKTTDAFFETDLVSFDYILRQAQESDFRILAILRQFLMTKTEKSFWIQES
ncbi:hypothetical protein V8Z74_04000 [Comamonas sp. w2-DMI]|uniref:hypothetical protein n=1 Tax=Comamonas sp. w2-DMI TaxID=3126391 RepID=UPI0032E4ABF5